MYHLEFGTRGAEFIKEFFNCAGSRELNKYLYFINTFVKPLDFDNLISSLSPSSLGRRAMIIDGQSRIGKTWAVVGAIANILDNYQGSTCWTSGEDSHKLFGGSDDPVEDIEPCKSILDGLKKIQDVLDGKQVDILFLDDFFGVVRLRPLMSPGERTDSLDSYFNWERRNNLLSKLIKEVGGVLVITNRSTLLTAAEVYMGYSIRHSKRTDFISVQRTPRGLFRLSDLQLIGAFDEIRLDEMYRLNRKAIVENQIYSIPHMLAFSSRAPKRFVRDKSNALALFGADFNELAFELFDLEDQVYDAGIEEDTTAIEALLLKITMFYKLYLISIAPGLLFPSPSLYDVLGISEESEKLINNLFLRFQDISIRRSRAPNEYFIRALNHHLAIKENVALGARAIKSVVINAARQDDPNVKVAIRGLLERALEPLSSNKKIKKLDLPSDLLELIQKKYKDPLFYWEMLEDPRSGSIDKLESCPGFAAAFGWALFHYKAIRNKIGDRAVEWFLNQLTKYAEKVNEKTYSDVNESNLLVTCYSTLLQWVIRADLQSKQLSTLHKVATGYPNANREIARKFKMVLEDELIWADSLRGSILDNSVIAQNIVESLRSDNPENENWNEWVSANRLFSIAWHNEWMSSKGYFKAELMQWEKRCREAALSVIRLNPDYLDDNLQYHWWHFMTQYGTWMRSWCFQNDPFKYEHDRVAPGSIRAEDNSLLVEIVFGLLEQSVASDTLPERIRSCLMLIGTRTARLLASVDLVGFLETLMEACETPNPKIKINILCAIYELARQGYLDNNSKDTTLEFREWCNDKLEAFGKYRKIAWGKYHQELTKVTYLDLLPRDDAKLGWEDIKPVE